MSAIKWIETITYDSLRFLEDNTPNLSFQSENIVKKNIERYYKCSFRNCSHMSMVSISCSNLRATLYTGSHDHSNFGVVKLADDYIRNFTSYYKEHKEPRFILRELHDKYNFIISKQLSNLINRNRSDF